MKLKALLYTLLPCVAITACSDDPVAGTDEATETILTISYSTDGYGAGLMSSRTASEETLCWSDWNEKLITSIDFYLLDAEGKVTFYTELEASSNECNVPHTLLEFKKGVEPIVGGLTFEILSEASSIAIVANHPISVTERVGSPFEDLYATLLSGLQPKERQTKFVMAGFFKLPSQLSRYSNIVVPLRRIAAKIRLTLKNDDQTILAASEFNSILCRYSTEAKVIADERMPRFREDFTANPTNIYPYFVTPDGPFAGIDWSYPDDITDVHPDSMVRENGHVYYTYPYDWVDYSKVVNKCSRAGNSGKHKNHLKEGGDRYEVTDLDDTPCISDLREMFLLVKAPYQGKQYFYRVPINYRLPTINDQQCYSAEDLTDRVFSLYRAERNHFYDITAFIDREGAASPTEAVDPAFTLTVAPMEDGGTYDYIYD